MVISKKKRKGLYPELILYFFLQGGGAAHFGKHCCKTTYKKSLIVPHVYFFSLFPIVPLCCYRPHTAPFLLTTALNLANVSWGAVAPTLGTTASDASFVSCVKCCRGIFSFFRKYDFFCQNYSGKLFALTKDYILFPIPFNSTQSCHI